MRNEDAAKDCEPLEEIEKRLLRAQAKMAHEFGLGGQARPPDPIENKSQAWGIYASFLNTVVHCRDAFLRAEVPFPRPLRDALLAIIDEAPFRNTEPQTAGQLASTDALQKP